jgi:dephospho-CoA kinase
MIRVGLTGTLAAGKTAVGRLFERWGAHRIDADELAREAVAPGSPGLEAIRREFGDEALDAAGFLDRTRMRRVAFASQVDRRRLEAIVHTEVRRLRAARLAEAGRLDTRIVIEEVPLLFEVGLEGEYDAIVVVDAPEAVRLERASRARGWTADEFASIEATQLPGAEKRGRAEYVIDNAGSREELEACSRLIWDELQSLAEAA